MRLKDILVIITWLIVFLTSVLQHGFMNAAIGATILAGLVWVMCAGVSAGRRLW